MHCPLAQSVEHAAVNRGVVSSSLSGAAKNSRDPGKITAILITVYVFSERYIAPKRFISYGVGNL